MIKKGETYIIGEIGQNHNGSVDIAKLIVELIARPVHEDDFNFCAFSLSAPLQSSSVETSSSCQNVYFPSNVVKC